MTKRFYSILFLCSLLTILLVTPAFGAVSFWPDKFVHGWHFNNSLVGVVNGTTFTITGNASFTEDKNGDALNALLIDNTGDTVNSESFNIANTTGETFSVWVKPYATNPSGWFTHGDTIAYADMYWYCDATNCYTSVGAANGGASPHNLTGGGGWQHIVIVFNSTASPTVVNTYHNSNLVAKTTLSGARDTGLGAKPLKLYSNANPSRRDEVTHFDTILSPAQVRELFLSYDQWDVTAVSSDNFTLTVNDQLSGGAINDFNATFTHNGSTWSLTSLSSPFTTNISYNSSDINVTITASKYFSNETLNHDTLTNLTMTMLPYPTIRATSAYNLTALSDFWVYWNDTNYTASATTLQIPAKGLIDINVSSFAHFVNITNNVSIKQGLNRSLHPYTEVYAVTHTGTTVNNFSINYSGNVYTTTTGVAYVPVFNVSNEPTTIFDAHINTAFYESKTRDLNATPYLINYTYSLFFSNSFILEFRNETTNERLVNKTVFLEVISVSFAANYTTSNGTLNLTLLTPDSYELRYWYEPEVPRQYFVTLTNQSVHTIVLYTIDDDISSFYVAVEKDESNQKCGNNTVSLLRYYLDINGYRTVEMSRTDTNGQAVFSVQPNIINYKFSFTGDCGDFITDPQKLIDTTNSFTVTNAQSPLTSTIDFPDILQSLVFVNATRTFTFTWNDPTNIVTSGCLEVNQIKKGVDTIVNDACLNGVSGSLIYTVTDINNTVFNARGVLNTNTQFSRSVITEQASFSSSLASLGLTGLFITILVVLALIMFGSQTAATTIVAAVGGLALMAYMGFFLNLQGTLPISIILLAIYGGILLYKMRT